MVKNIQIIVYGKVQGVSFRSFAKQNADSLHINGYTKNLKDGSLKIVAEGEEQKIQEFVEKIKVGPPDAKVENVSIVERGYMQNFTAFETF